MLYGSIECSVKCRKCDEPVPLNGPWEAAHCDHCQNDFSIPHEFWADIFKDMRSDIDDETGDLKEGEARNATVFGIFHTTLLAGRLKARCEKCKTPIPVNPNPGAAFVHTCPQCGLKTNVIPAPAWLKQLMPIVDHFVAATLQTSGEDKSDQSRAKPVIFTCPQCGGALKVDGSERMIECSYCNASVYLPDDLWLRLHPARTRARWFIGFGG
jgi:Zn finger protein HypA/HybF involved in hydrogenase expression